MRKFRYIVDMTESQSPNITSLFLEGKSFVDAARDYRLGITNLRTKRQANTLSTLKTKIFKVNELGINKLIGTIIKGKIVYAVLDENIKEGWLNLTKNSLDMNKPKVKLKNTEMVVVDPLVDKLQTVSIGLSE